MAVLVVAGAIAAVAYSQASGGTEATATFTNVVTYTIPAPLTVTETTTQTVTETVPGPTTTVTTPPRVVLFGASTPPNHTTTREAEARWLEGKMGRKLGITRHYVKATSGWLTGGAQESLDSGRSVIVTFTSGGDSWSQVTNGSLDSYVCNQSAATKQYGKRMYVSFENEPEAETPGKGSPAQYVTAYQHLIAKGNSCGFAGHWTTALMEFSWQSGSGRNPEAWVPNGIDTLGVHVYFTRVGSCGAGIRSFSSGVDDPYATAVAHNLRMGIWEWGYSTAVGANPEAKADFFRSIPGALANFPRIDALTYWNQGSGSCADANSYYIDSSPAALQGWVDAGHAPILGG